ncbi:hypothetical protein GH733_015030, partial [Mirounga leonina]
MWHKGWAGTGSPKAWETTVGWSPDDRLLENCYEPSRGHLVDRHAKCPRPLLPNTPSLAKAWLLSTTLCPMETRTRAAPAHAASVLKQGLGSTQVGCLYGGAPPLIKALGKFPFDERPNGLNSLDQVEIIILAMEDDSGFEIPDTDMEKLMCPQEIVYYIADKKD